MLTRAATSCVVLCGLAGLSWAQGTVVNHTNCDGNALTPGVSAQIGQTTSFFAHASVGGNVTSGLGHLHSRDPNRYPLHTASDDGVPPSSTVAGTFYEYQRGNPGWQSKINLFETYMAQGWGDSNSVTIASNKFCYVDEDASWTVFRDSMVALEANYPTVSLIYWTIPLMNTENADNRLRNDFNKSLRDWMALPAQTGKILFDIADIEAWDPNGVQSTFTYNSVTYQKMYNGYTSDGGHLNTAGSDLVAMGLYVAYGAAVPEPASGAMVLAGLAVLLRRRRGAGRARI